MGETMRAPMVASGWRLSASKLASVLDYIVSEPFARDPGAAREIANGVEQLRFRPGAQQPVNPLVGRSLFLGRACLPNSSLWPATGNSTASKRRIASISSSHHNRASALDEADRAKDRERGAMALQHRQCDLPGCRNSRRRRSARRTARCLGRRRAGAFHRARRTPNLAPERRQARDREIPA